MKKTVSPRENPLLSDGQMEEHVQLAIEGATGRAVDRTQFCSEIDRLKEQSSRAATRIVLGMADAGLNFSYRKGTGIEQRVTAMLIDENREYTPGHIAALLRRYTRLVRYQERQKRRRLPETDPEDPETVDMDEAA